MEHLSRYYNVETTEHEVSEDRTVTYLRRRFLPRGEAMATLTHVSFEAGDRLDLITSRTLGDAEQYWRVCDANDVMHPGTLERTGTRVRVPVPQV
jgi:hypothetical protein